MFNLGSDDKKELQENMKEIKSLIDGKKDQQESGQDLDFGSDRENEGQSAPNLGNQNQGDTNQGFDDQVQTQVNKENPQDFSNETTNNAAERENNQVNQSSNQQAAQSNQRGEGFMQGNTENQNNSRSGQNNLQRNQSNENVVSEREVRSQRQSQTSQAKTESNENEEREVHEPLFLREEQFTDIREMVEEMSYLTQEMSQKVDSMKKTVRNERDISKDSDELVEAFTQRRSEVESTIKSGQN